MLSAWRTQRFEAPGSAIAGVCAASNEDRPRWYFATCDGWLLGVDGDTGARFFELRLPFDFEGVVNSAALVASSDGRFVAVVPALGVLGALIDVQAARVVQVLERTGDLADVTFWPLAMVRRHGREFFMVGSEADVIEAYELPTLERQTGTGGAHEPQRYARGVLSPSPSGRWLATSGWYFHPVGSLELFDVDAWVHRGVPGAREAMFRSRSWDWEVCWVSETQFACGGDEGDGSHAFGDGLPYFDQYTGVVIFDVEARAVAHFLPAVAPRRLGSDGSWLYLLGETTQAVRLDDQTWAEPLEVSTHAWHRGARVALSCPALEGKPGPCQLVWHPAWSGPRLSDSTRERARALQRSLTVNGLRVLADALEEAGVTGDALAHCRSDQPHGARCWVVESVLEPE